MTGSPIYYDELDDPRLACYTTPGWEPAEVRQIAAGNKITVYPFSGSTGATTVFHPGIFTFHLARVPEHEDFATWEPSGDVWFKYHQYGRVEDKEPPFLWWESQVVTRIPKELAPGNYLLRFEHIALHIEGMPQFYPTCWQFNVTSDGTAAPPASALNSIPGIYSLDHPTFHIPTGVPNDDLPPWKGYPGPEVWKP